MNIVIRLAAVASVLAICVSANADPWKDESGHGRGGSQWGGGGGEPADWARGKRVWDDIKHRRGGPPAWAGRSRHDHDGRYGTGYRAYQQPRSYSLGQPYSGGYSGYGTTYGGNYSPYQSYGTPYQPYGSPYSHTPYPSFGW